MKLSRVNGGAEQGPCAAHFICYATEPYQIQNAIEMFTRDPSSLESSLLGNDPVCSKFAKNRI